MQQVLFHRALNILMSSSYLSFTFSYKVEQYESRKTILLEITNNMLIKRVIINDITSALGFVLFAIAFVRLVSSTPRREPFYSAN